MRHCQQESVAIWIPWFAGLIFPPNHLTAVFNVTYAPAVTLTFAAGVANHTSTFVTPLMVTATFGDPVVGVQPSDFLVTGGVPRDVVQLEPNVYTALLDLGPLDSVVVGMDKR